jgi:hypothetical protein
MASDGRVESLYYELGLRAEAMEAGKAKAAAVLKDIEIIAAKTGKSIDEVAAAANRAGVGNKGIREIASNLGDAGAKGERAAVGLHAFMRPLESLATEAISANAQVGNLASKLATLGLGAGVTIAILAGIAAIAKAWDLITAGAEKARKKTDEFIERMLSLGEEQTHVGVSGARADLQRAQEILDEANARVKAAEGALKQQQQSDEPSVTAQVAAARALAAARRDVAKATEAQAAASREFVKASFEDQAATARALGNLLVAGSARPSDRTAAANMLHDLNLELKQLPASAEFRQRRSDIQGLIDVLTAADKAAAARGVRAENRNEQVGGIMSQLEGLKASLTPGGADDLTVKLTALRDKLGQLKPTPEEIAAFRALKTEIEGLAKAATAEDLGRELRDLISNQTPTLVDNMKDKLDDLKKALSAKGAPQEFIDQVSAIEQSMISAQGESEALDKEIKQLQADLAGGFNLKGDLSKVEAQIDALIEARNAAQAGVAGTKEGTPERAAAQATLNSKQSQLDQLLVIEVQLRAKIKELQDASAKHTASIAQQTATLTGNIANAANAAFGLASAFLGVDSNITKALGSIGQLAGGISNVSSLANSAGGFGKLFSSTSGVLSALPGLGQAIGGAIALGSALFGKSPEEIRRQQLQKENTEALRQLSQRVGELGVVNVTGTQFGQLEKLFSQSQIKDLEKLFSQPGVSAASGVFTPDKVNRLIGQALDAVGLSATQFKEIAAQFGVTIDAAAKITMADIDELKKHIAETELTKFADTFEGELSQFQATVNVFNLTKPIDQFNALKKSIGAISGGGGALQQLLDTFDLTTSQGVNDAITALQNLFIQLQTLPQDQAATFLGNLTPEQFQQLLQQALGIVRAQAGSGDVAGTGGFNVDRSITEVTGSRLAALLSTDVIWNQQTAENTAKLVGLLSGAAPPLISAPSIPNAKAGAGLAGDSLQFDVTINFTGVPDSAGAQRAGKLVSDAMIEEIDQKLAKRLKRNQMARGIHPGSRRSNW